MSVCDALSAFVLAPPLKERGWGIFSENVEVSERVLETVREGTSERVCVCVRHRAEGEEERERVPHRRQCQNIEKSNLGPRAF